MALPLGPDLKIWDDVKWSRLVEFMLKHVETKHILICYFNLGWRVQLVVCCWLTVRQCDFNAATLSRTSQVDVDRNLVRGFKHVLWSKIYGIILPIEFHIFQDGFLTTNQTFCSSADYRIAFAFWNDQMDQTKKLSKPTSDRTQALSSHDVSSQGGLQPWVGTSILKLHSTKGMY